MDQNPAVSAVAERFCAPSTEEVNASHTVWLGRLVKSLSGMFSNESVPSSTVVAPAPATGASMAPGAVWAMVALSVRLT